MKSFKYNYVELYFDLHEFKIIFNYFIFNNIHIICIQITILVMLQFQYHNKVLFNFCIYNIVIDQLYNLIT